MMLDGALQVNLFVVGPEHDLKEKYAELSLVKWTGFLYVDKWYGQVRSFVRRWLVLGVVKHVFCQHQIPVSENWLLGKTGPKSLHGAVVNVAGH